MIKLRFPDVRMVLIPGYGSNCVVSGHPMSKFEIRFAK